MYFIKYNTKTNKIKGFKHLNHPNPHSLEDEIAMNPNGTDELTVILDSIGIDGLPDLKQYLFDPTTNTIVDHPDYISPPTPASFSIPVTDIINSIKK